MNIQKALYSIFSTDFSLCLYTLTVSILTFINWDSLNSGYPTTTWILAFISILISGRILLFFSHKLRLHIVIMFRLLYFLLTNIWAIVGIFFYIKANEVHVIFTQDLSIIYKFIMIFSIAVCFFISFALRKGSLNIPYRQSVNPRLIEALDTPVSDLQVIDRWVIDFDVSLNEICVICREELVSKPSIVRIPECRHVFHKKCIKRWIRVKANCPVCKTELCTYF